MTDLQRPASMYGPMPEVGTRQVCDFCRQAITLRRAESGWHYWTTASDPVDGGNHCLGGVPPRRGGVRTLHVPAPMWEPGRPRVLRRWYWRYTPEGEGRFA